MRRFFGISLLMAGIVWIGPVAAHADRTPGRVLNTEPSSASARRLSDQTPEPVTEAPSEQVVEATEGTRIAEGTTVDVQTGNPTPESAAAERQILGQLRGYQALLEREEKLLEQRMEYAGRIRQAGLERQDKKLLDQAEDYERRSLAAYLNAIKQFERARFSSGVQTPAATPSTTTRSPAPAATPRVQGRTPTQPATRSTPPSHPNASRRFGPR